PYNCIYIKVIDFIGAAMCSAAAAIAICRLSVMYGLVYYVFPVYMFHNIDLTALRPVAIGCRVGGHHPYSRPGTFTTVKPCSYLHLSIGYFKLSRTFNSS